MKKLIVLSCLLVFLYATTILTAQNVGIGTDNPHNSAKLHIVDANRGILIPEISIVSLSNSAPVSSPANGLLVYNTNTSVTGGFGKGFYYWNSTAWSFLGRDEVDNGLLYDASSSTIRLGGNLVKNTSFTQGNYNVNFDLTGSGDFNIKDNGTTHFQVRDNGLTYFGDDTYWNDGSSSGTTLARLYDSGNDGVFQIYKDGSIQHSFNSVGTSVFNEQGGNNDFRIESDGNSSMFFVDASTNRVGIGTTSPVDKFHVNSGRVEFTATTDANGTAGSGVLEIGNSLRIDPNEIITNSSTILYLQNDNNGDLRVDGSSFVVDASTNRVGLGTTIPLAKLDVRGDAIFNESSGNYDFRIESDGRTHAFWMDASANIANFGSSAYSAYGNGSTVNNTVCNM